MTKKESSFSWWPVGIIGAMASFMLFIGSLVFGAFNADSELVKDAYYADELTYQNEIDAQSRSLKAGENLQGDYLPESQNYRLRLDKTAFENTVTGRLNFYRPSDSSLDFEVPISTDATGEQIVSLEGKADGLWRVFVHFSYQNKEYSAQYVFKKK